jgi:hypothetical protein
MYAIYYLCCYFYDDAPVIILVTTNHPCLRAGCHKGDLVIDWFMVLSVIV